MDIASYEPWPALDYEEFSSTAHILHMTVQMLGKLKLTTPFQPHWANVGLALTSQGISTGPIPYKSGTFNIKIDLLSHKIIGVTSWGEIFKFNLQDTSVAEIYEKLFSHLRNLQVDLTINPNPQEISNPIPFDKDTTIQIYKKELANAWWRILLSTYKVMTQYHSHFDGESPPIALMWGTFDIRDARYNGVAVPTTGANAGYIRRNAMNEGQMEVGFWSGFDLYHKPAFYAFIYPQPEAIEKAKIEPKSAYWNKELGEFILDYAELRKSSNPDKDLLDFFESSYRAGSTLAKWDSKMNVAGNPQ